MQPVGDGMFVMTAGRAGPEGLHTLCLDFLKSDLPAKLRTRFGGIVADLPPVLESADGPLLARGFDQLVLVVRAAATPVRYVQDAARALPSEPAIILNGGETNLPRWLRRLTSR